MPKAYSLKEVSQIAGVSINTLREYCKSGRIKAKRIINNSSDGVRQPRGRNEWRVSREEVARVFGV